MKIYALKSGSLNELERLEIAKLLVKAGYTVKLGKEKANGKSSSYTHYVEYLDGEEETG